MQTQVARLYAFLKANPGASSLEIQSYLRITNATGRMSDLRKEGERQGFVVVKAKRPDGRDGYSVRDNSEMTLGLAS
jgi:hypothetical protein